MGTPADPGEFLEPKLFPFFSVGIVGVPHFETGTSVKQTPRTLHEGSEQSDKTHGFAF